MFRKIVSNLAFSPALVGQLGFYAKRLRKEETTRRAGLIFTALALVVQSFAVFTPPESANAASSRDFIYGGVTSLNQFLTAYDKNQGNLKDIFNYAGITRAEIAATKLATWKVSDKLSWGRKPAVSTAQGEVKHVIRDNNGKAVTTVYSHPQDVFFKDGASDYGWVGYSKKVGWFAISKACANLVTKKLPPPPVTPVAACSNLVITPISRTQFKLTGSTSAKNGATISSYTFVVKDTNNTTVVTKTTSSTSTTASTDVSLTTPGTYTATVTAASNLGTLTGANCRKHINVEPPAAKDITVCDLTTKKMITIKETAFDSKKHSKDAAVCTTPEPAYACTSLTVKQISYNKVSFTTDHSVKNATYKSVNYAIKDANGKQLYKGPNNTYTQSTPGAYSVQATITVLAGDKTVTATSGDCRKDFIIAQIVPKSEKVCLLTDRSIITIQPAEFNPKLHSTNLNDCDKVDTLPCPVNATLPANSPDCQPCPGDESIWVKDAECAAQITKTKNARNITTQANATETSVKAGESLQYALTVRNEGTQESSVDVVDELYDVLEYATLTDAGTGTFDEKTNTLNWQVTSLAPGAEVTYYYTVKMNATLAATATGASDKFSYDCRMVNTFGNSITVNVDCPPTKVVESAIQELPKTGPGMNMLAAGIVTAIAVFFYARSKQLTKEVRLIRRDLNSGTI